MHYRMESILMPNLKPFLVVTSPNGELETVNKKLADLLDKSASFYLVASTSH